ncbi:N-acetylmuramoyl-L-alanine amidase [Virgibacillus phasianinus]|uniref:N-acetylmuramoyl-L-alanine amidase n=1 Tax=Virgibacillus phasianinus TaxID=2017483 RepID=A0A220U490_9BACI|nr:N-acetylmuramoyl-L-alanine amidase [Virgibacillus phasianinus]ASK63094.1 N-acetylmuramoyl-L-alanine amidase [Virgibacillus phasianinus]
MRTLKMLGICLGILLILTAMTNPVHAKKAVIHTDILNVRSGPGQNFEEITEVHANETYPIVNEQGDWVQIQLDSTKGWVTSEYISIQEEKAPDKQAKKKNQQPSVQTLTIPYKHTHLRSGPSTEYEIVGFADKGMTFDVLSETDEWYEVKHDDLKGYLNKRFIKDAAESASTGIENKTIVIDAGHGGRDVGAIGASGTFEKDYTYKTTMELKQELTILGANVILTRSQDEFISLGSRASYSNVAGTDAFISIHYNSTPALPNVTGIGTYYYHGQNKKLATYIQQGLIKETNADDRGVAFGDFAVIRQNFKPAVLVELGFLSNPEKEKLLQTDAYQKKLVQGMINGLLKYFANK